MIVQTSPDVQHFVIMQTDHARTCGKLAEAFGNDDFQALMPADLMVFVIAHHDEGWAEIDENAETDLDTGLPFNLTKTPIVRLIDTGGKSPDFNEAHHAYCGLISSMHTWGLYHGRYGLSDKIFIDMFPAEYRPQVDKMLAHEKARQERLKQQLTADPTTAGWVQEDVLFHNYKLLQFFDTLALYFQTTHESTRTETRFQNVPRAVGDDVEITLTPLGDGRYQLSPYPFNAPELSFATEGRYMQALSDNADVPSVMKAVSVDQQTFTLVQSS